MIPREDWSTLKKLIYLRGSGAAGGGSWSTIVGNPVQFTALASPLKSLSASFSPVQAAGTPSPDNPLPISGWDGVTVELTGKNLWNPSVVFGTWSQYTVNADQSVTIASTNGTGWASDENVPVFLKAGKYTIWRSNPVGNLAVRKSTDNYGSNVVIVGNGYASATFTLTEDCDIKVKVNTGAGENYPNTSFCSLTVGEEVPTAYVPYTGRSISLSFGSTLYSGTLDVLTGVVTVTGVKFGTEYIHTQASANSASLFSDVNGNPSMLRFYHLFGSIVQASTRVNCLVYEKGAGSWQTMASKAGTAFIIDGSYAAIRLPNYGLEDKQAFTDWIENSGIEVYVELATPQTIQLTPQQLSSLAGENVMWSNVNGDLTVEYRSA